MPRVINQIMKIIIVSLQFGSMISVTLHTKVKATCITTAVLCWAIYIKFIKSCRYHIVKLPIHSRAHKYIIIKHYYSGYYIFIYTASQANCIVEAMHLDVYLLYLKIYFIFKHYHSSKHYTMLFAKYYLFCLKVKDCFIHHWFNVWLQ